MADIIEKVLTKAKTYDLLSLEELKVAMQIDPDDTSQDAQLSQQITRFSDVVSRTCNRVFARERMMETWRELGCQRIFLGHFPVAETDVESVECPRGYVLDPSQYEIEEASAKIELLQARSEPIVVTYTGGFNLPDDAPPALKEATELMIRESQALAARLLTSGIRSLMHKEARVMFFDPLTLLTKREGFGWATTAANALLMHYVRFQV
jgi:hypothetical protein